jgi:CheY-like chemotaxis protein
MILLVDDDELIRDAAPELLALLGHQVSIAASGAEGLERVEADPELDVVILDVNMPDMSGVETLAHLRSLRPGLPVILATGFLGDAVKEILDSDPRVLALSKPYTLEEARVKLVEAAGR